MLWTAVSVLPVLWLLGPASRYTLGGFFHLLFVLAVAAILVLVLRGRRAI